MKILAIETSCDETSIAFFEMDITNSGIYHGTLFGHTTHSQIDVHKEFGGVFPALAKREHKKNIIPTLLHACALGPVKNMVITDAQKEAARAILAKDTEVWEMIETHIISQQQQPDCDAICVTYGPGLEPALWVGIVCAQALGVLWNVPVIPVNHMEGHIVSVLFAQEDSKNEFPKPITCTVTDTTPALALLISGGHTELVSISDYGHYKKIGKTRDDAVGEAFDKVARMLGLDYPGGPEISRLAKHYTPDMDTPIFPRPMIHSGDYDFSFSGLKTAVLYYIKELAQPLTETQKIGIAYAFETAVTEVLVTKTKRVLENDYSKTLIVAGGVSANQTIIRALQEMIHKNFPDVSLRIPDKTLTGDNALMIGLAGFLKYIKNPNHIYDTIRADGNASL